jgi:hypothetical protein
MDEVLHVPRREMSGMITATQDRTRQLFALGLQQRSDAECHLGRYLERIV